MLLPLMSVSMEQPSATYRLDEEIDTWIDGYQGGQNHLVIQDGCARIEEADCPDKLCVKQGTVSKVGSRWFAAE